jgi:hypothetical protein
VSVHIGNVSGCDAQFVVEFDVSSVAVTKEAKTIPKDGYETRHLGLLPIFPRYFGQRFNHGGSKRELPFS